MSQILLPTYLNVGGGSINQITDILKGLECKKPIIITDKTLVKLGLLGSLEKSLTSMQIIYKIFEDTIPEPTASSVPHSPPCGDRCPCAPPRFLIAIPFRHPN